ncbi:MAG: porin family protein [Bacteroidales bacterium]|nr:porin family protein [Bacteroidales bacterium]
MKNVTRFILAALVLLCSAKVYAFEPADYKWNITPSYMLTFGASNLKGFNHNDIGGGFSLDVSYRLNKNLEVGMYGSISAFDRCYEALNFENLKINATEDFMSTNLLATANYNYRTSRYVELSVGLGLGWMYAEKDADYAKSCNSLVVMPRISVKVRSHVKFSLGYKWQEKANRHAFISVGYTFGAKKF